MQQNTLFIPLQKNNICQTFRLPASKSESNRVLLIEALAAFQAQKKNAWEGYTSCQIANLSKARDTQTMQRLLQSKEELLDVLDAGTTMRFLTAFAAITQRKTTLTGTPRMCQRPIGVLVEALRTLGAEITYLENEGFPPIAIRNFSQKTQEIAITGEVSSQYISALLMVAPLLEQPLQLILTNKIYSKPYIEMTLSLMSHFGIEATWKGDTIGISPHSYQMQNYTIEADWSAASYWYSVAALSERAVIFLPHLKAKSLQGDSIIASIGASFGVHTAFEAGGARLTKNKENESVQIFSYDFSHCPDLAQTLVALCVGIGIEMQAGGVESLKIKETNRLEALKNEVTKFGYDFSEQESGVWHLKKRSDFPNKQIKIYTYDDHRMAMAFAPLALRTDLAIENPEVVGKSYPDFWEEFAKINGQEHS